jgi:hypothetical protein
MLIGHCVLANEANETNDERKYLLENISVYQMFSNGTVHTLELLKGISNKKKFFFALA